MCGPHMEGDDLSVLKTASYPSWVDTTLHPAGSAWEFTVPVCTTGLRPRSDTAAKQALAFAAAAPVGHDPASRVWKRVTIFGLRSVHGHSMRGE